MDKITVVSTAINQQPNESVGQSGSGQSGDSSMSALTSTLRNNGDCSLWSGVQTLHSGNFTQSLLNLKEDTMI